MQMWMSRLLLILVQRACTHTAGIGRLAMASLTGLLVFCVPFAAYRLGSPPPSRYLCLSATPPPPPIKRMSTSFFRVAFLCFGARLSPLSLFGRHSSLLPPHTLLPPPMLSLSQMMKIASLLAMAGVAAAGTSVRRRLLRCPRNHVCICMPPHITNSFRSPLAAVAPRSSGADPHRSAR